MIDIMTRLKVHHMAEGFPAVIASSCSIGLCSVERTLQEPEPSLSVVAAGVRAGGAKLGRPSMADESTVQRIQKLLVDERRIMPTEVLRRSRAWGHTGSRSAMGLLVKRLRPAPTAEPIVRFDGLPGE